jgi:hypothetical protein
MNVLSQYAVGNGVGGGQAAGLFVQSSNVGGLSGTVSNADITSTIQSCIDAGVIPEPPANNTSNVLVIYFDETVEFNDTSFTPPITMCEPQGDTAFGYHDFFTTSAGNSFYYAVIPALDDACLQNSCPDDNACSLHLFETQEQRRTQVTSHEFAEMCTDPQLNAWFDPDPNTGECGDICNGEADEISGPSGNSWTVQRQYSKFDDVNTNGVTFCLAQSPTPEPKLSPGFTGMAIARAGVQQMRMTAVSSLLPLPTMHLDKAKQECWMDEEQARRRVNELFHPLRYHHVVADLPNFLRDFANLIEKDGARRRRTS